MTCLRINPGHRLNRTVGVTRQLTLLTLGAAVAIIAGLATTACDRSGAVGRSTELRPLVGQDASKRRPLVRRGDLLVAKRSGRLAILRRSGRLVRRIPRFVARKGVQAIELAPDRRHAFVSVNARPTWLYEVSLATGAHAANATSPSLSPDRSQLAYVTSELDVDIVYRTALVIRDLRTGQAHSIPLGPEVPEGTPPELVINWSPDGTRVAIFDGDRIRLADVRTAKDVVSQPSVSRGLAPVFLDAHTLVVLGNCCIGRQRLVDIDLSSGTRKRFASLSSPVENIRRLRSGLLLTVTALNELALVSRGQTRVIARAITAATG
jgi:WD40-like Beta Propeller Repeat